MNQIFQLRYYAALQLKGLKNCQRSNLQFQKKTFYKSRLTCKNGYRDQVRPFHYKATFLIFINSTVLLATRMHNTSFERSESYLFRFILEKNITELKRYFISAERYVIYFILHGYTANQIQNHGKIDCNVFTKLMVLAFQISLYFQDIHGDLFNLFCY